MAKGTFEDFKTLKNQNIYYKLTLKRSSKMPNIFEKLNSSKEQFQDVKAFNKNGTFLSGKNKDLTMFVSPSMTFTNLISLLKIVLWIEGNTSFDAYITIDDKLWVSELKNIFAPSFLEKEKTYYRIPENECIYKYLYNASLKSSTASLKFTFCDMVNLPNTYDIFVDFQTFSFDSKHCFTVYSFGLSKYNLAIEEKASDIIDKAEKDQISFMTKFKANNQIASWCRYMDNYLDKAKSNWLPIDSRCTFDYYFLNEYFKDTYLKNTNPSPEILDIFYNAEAWKNISKELWERIYVNNNFYKLYSDIYEPQLTEKDFLVFEKKYNDDFINKINLDSKDINNVIEFTLKEVKHISKSNLNDYSEEEFKLAFSVISRISEKCFSNKRNMQEAFYIFYHIRSKVFEQISSKEIKKYSEILNQVHFLLANKYLGEYLAYSSQLDDMYRDFLDIPNEYIPKSKKKKSDIN